MQTNKLKPSLLNQTIFGENNNFELANIEGNRRHGLYFPLWVKHFGAPLSIHRKQRGLIWLCMDNTADGMRKKKMSRFYIELGCNFMQHNSSHRFWRIPNSHDQIRNTLHIFHNVERNSRDTCYFVSLIELHCKCYSVNKTEIKGGVGTERA